MSQRTIKIIETVKLRDPKTGNISTVTGAATEGWEEVYTGTYTVEKTDFDGTVSRGTGYPPFETYAQAEEFVADYVRLHNAIEIK